MKIKKNWKLRKNWKSGKNDHWDKSKIGENWIRIKIENSERFENLEKFENQEKIGKCGKIENRKN